MAGQAGCRNVEHHPWRLPNNQAQKDKAHCWWNGGNWKNNHGRDLKYNMYIHGRYGQGRSADVIPWIQPSYCQVLETCVSSSAWECHCECAHLVQTACTVIVHQGKSTKQPLEVWQRARKRNCWSGVAWHGSYEYLIFLFRGLKGVMDKYIYIFHTFNIVSSNTFFLLVCINIDNKISFESTALNSSIL